MSDGEAEQPPTAEPAEPDRERRRRLAEVFGEVLPETTSDEREPSPPADEEDRESWLRREVPPHHG